MKTWRDIKLRQAQEIALLGEMDELDLIINQMAIIRDTTIDEIEKLSPTELIEFTKEYGFLNKVPEMKLTKVFKKGRNRYGIIDFDKMTLAQMVDIEEYYKDGLQKNLHKILSVLYLDIKWYNPFTKKYTLCEYEADKEREDVFLDMDMEFIWENILFFYHLEKVYIKNLRDYLITTHPEMKEMMMNLMED
jgi:hypothetical protein